MRWRDGRAKLAGRRHRACSIRATGERDGRHDDDQGRGQTEVKDNRGFELGEGLRKSTRYMLDGTFIDGARKNKRMNGGHRVKVRGYVSRVDSREEAEGGEEEEV